MADIIDFGGGLISDDAWKPRFPDFDCRAFQRIRSSLLKRIDGLRETFNPGPVSYFSYKVSDDPCVLHIYPQVRLKRLLVDINLDRAIAEPALQAEGFDIEYRDNFQGRAGWLTGWRIPCKVTITASILNWLEKAFHGEQQMSPGQLPKLPTEPRGNTRGAAEGAEQLLSNDNTVALKPRGPSLATGREVGRSRVVGYLGRGGMGEVYEVEHLRLGKRYALKVILPEHAREEGFVERFEREARVTARLEHPNIIRVDDFGEEDGLYWIRMELARGVDVGRLLGADHEGRASSLAALAHAAGGRLPEQVVAQLAEGMLEGVAHAHAGGVVHRDLKPANVLLTAGPRGDVQPKVSDFGLARVVGEDMVRSLAELSARMDLSEAATGQGATTSAVSLVGTYEYMSPEQRRGEAVGPASDVYAAGLVIYRLLTGRHSPGFKRPSEVAQGIDPFWDGFLEKALEEDLKERFADAGEMLASLRARRGPVASPTAATATIPKPATADPTADALAARTESRRLQARARAATESSEPAIARMIAKADSELSLGEAASDRMEPARAVQHFQQAKALLEGAAEASKIVPQISRAELDMNRARDSAMALRADGFASRDYGAASRAAEEAAKVREAGDLERAIRFYREAFFAYELAADTAQPDAALRNEALALRAKGLEWKHRDEPALRRMLELADSTVTKVDDALAARDSAGAVRLAREAKDLYEKAFGLEPGLKDCVRVEREARTILDECVRLDAERHAAGDLTSGMSLLEQSSVLRSEGNFRKAGAFMREARDSLRKCRDTCLRARGRRVSGLAIKVLALLIILTGVIAIFVWLLARRRLAISGDIDASSGRPVAGARMLDGGAGERAYCVSFRVATGRLCRVIGKSGRAPGPSKEGGA